MNVEVRRREIRDIWDIMRVFIIDGECLMININSFCKMRFEIYLGNEYFIFKFVLVDLLIVIYGFRNDVI